MTLNAYLLAQAAVFTAAAAPQGMTTGEWVALASLFIVMAGVVYRAGVASQEAKNTKGLVVGKLEEFSKKLDAINEFIKDTQELRVLDARWKADIGGRVERLEDIQPVHTHRRTND
jgi:hypothetical protein